MSRAPIQYAEEHNRVVLTYHLPDGWCAPLVGFWCIAAGAAVGTGAAVALTALGLTELAAFRWVLLAVTGLVAVLLYVFGYLWGRRTRFLRITFDHAADRIEVNPAYRANRRPTQYASEDVFAFRLLDRSTPWRAGCALVMEKYDDEPETLLVLDRPCANDRSGLSRFVAGLEAQLEAVPDGEPVEPKPHPSHFPLIRPIPAQRGLFAAPAAPPVGEQDDPYDAYDDQQPAE